MRIVGAQAAIALADRAGLPDPARAMAVQRAFPDRQILAWGGGRSGECLILLPPLNIPADVLRPVPGTVRSLVGHDG